MIEETFDFRESVGENIYVKVDTLNKNELKKIYEHLDSVQEEVAQEAVDHSIDYAYNALLPIIKDFAFLTSSLLEVHQEDDRSIVEFCLKNENGFDITESCRAMLALLVMAVNVEFSIVENETQLRPVFDCRNIIS